MDQIAPLRVTVNEAATALRISRAQLYKHIAAGRLHPQKDGTRTLIAVEELRRFVDDAAAAPGTDSL